MNCTKHIQRKLIPQKSNFQLVLKEAVARHGICNKLYTDNGGPYVNSQLKMILASLGIIEIHAPIRDGAAKAKVERSFRTIKDTWLNGFDPASVNSLEDLNRLLSDYVRMRNNSVNRNTGETPMERYSRHIDRIRFPKSREWLDECFMNRIIRKVNNDSTVSACPFLEAPGVSAFLPLCPEWVKLMPCAVLQKP